MLPVFSRHAWVYRQLPLDPGYWSLVCFSFQKAYYIDISLRFGLRCVAAHCQDVTTLITRELNRKGAAVLSYINNFGGIAMDQATAVTHFNNLKALLARPGLQEVAHKASPPSQVMVWLGLQFDTVAMTVSLPPDKLSEIELLVHTWSLKPKATLPDLHTFLGKSLCKCVHKLACSSTEGWTPSGSAWKKDLSPSPLSLERT